MEIPIEKRLKKKAHVQIARLQDELMQILYQIDPELVFHGGTCIWRCYNGGRFSEDLDLYLGKLGAKKLTEQLKGICLARGLKIDKLKETENLIFAKISDEQTQVRVEINKINYENSVPLHYENNDGSKMIVMGLGVQELLAEKSSAYASRKLIRDIYDIYFLSGMLGQEQKMPKEVYKLIKKLPKPLDEENLAVIIYSGAIPTFESMVRMIRARL